MKTNILSFSLFATILLISARVQAAELSDLNHDTEDIMNESDAAVAQTKDFKAKQLIIKASADSRHQVASQTLKLAEQRRQKTLDNLHQSESEIQRLNSETAKWTADAARLDGEALETEKTTTSNLAQIEKMKVDIQNLKQVRAEKAAHFLELASERDKSQRELDAIQAEKTQAETELAQASLQEKDLADKLGKFKTEQGRTTAKLQTELVQLKERYNQAQDHQQQMQNEKTELERNTLKLEAQRQAGALEVNHAEEPEIMEQANSSEDENVAVPVAVPAVTPATLAPHPAKVAQVLSPSASPARQPTSQPLKAEMTFKRKCRVFDGPVRGSNVLAVQESGMSIAKTEEGKQWISFLLQDGRKAFAAKNCFR